jgi:hypothetical protein
VTLVDPAGTGAGPGSGNRLGRLLLTFTTIPLAGAFPLRRTVNLAFSPLAIEDGAERLLRIGSLIRTIFVLTTPLYLAVIATGVSI